MAYYSTATAVHEYTFQQTIGDAFLPRQQSTSNGRTSVHFSPYFISKLGLFRLVPALYLGMYVVAIYILSH